MSKKTREEYMHQHLKEFVRLRTIFEERKSNLFYCTCSGTGFHYSALTCMLNSELRLYMWHLGKWLKKMKQWKNISNKN